MREIIVIKIGGKLLLARRKRKTLLNNILSLSKKYSVAVVHGGKYQINKALKGKKPRFVKGQRYTDKETLKQVASTLARVNKELIKEFNSIQQGKAIGLCGIYGGMIKVERIKSLGYVGKIKHVDTKLIKLFLANNHIPVIFPICANKKTILNVNADNVASAIAIALNAKKLIFVSDVPGILGKNGKIIPKINLRTGKHMKKANIITEGMIPKVDGCFDAIKKGVKEIYITNKTNFIRKKIYVSGTYISI